MKDLTTGFNPQSSLQLPKDKGPTTTKLATIPEERETDEVESTDAPSDLPELDEVPTTEVTAPPPTLSQDADQTIKTFAFSGQVQSLNLPPLTTASAEQTVTFFTAQQDETPTAISLSGKTAIFTYGDKSVKVDLGTLAGLLKKGEVAGDSRLVQALIVAQTVGELGLSGPQAREITRSFVKDLKAGQSPAMARINAYTTTVACASLGPDPKAQLEKDMTAVQGFFSQFKRMTGQEPDKALQQGLTDLLAKRMTAIANNDFSAAFDLQEQARLLAAKNGLPKVGSEAHPLQEPSNQIANAAEAHDAPESGMTEELMALLPGESTNWASDGEGGVTVGVGVGIAVPGASSVGASAKVEGTARLLGKSSGLVERESSGDFVVTIRSYVGGGLKGDGSLTAGVELAGGGGAGDLGHLSVQKLRFATARDAAKFLAARELEDAGEVKHPPQKLADASPTDRPKAGQYVVVEESSGLATRTETTKRTWGITPVSQKSTASGGGIWCAIQRLIPGLSNKTVATETTRFKTTTGNKVTERAYAMTSTTGAVGNWLLKLVTLGMAGRTMIRTKVDLKLREVKPPPLAKGVQGPQLATEFKPSLAFQIDSYKVRACKSEANVEILAAKEFDRALSLAKAANKDAGQPVLDLSPDGQTYLKESIRKSLMLIFNEANRTPKGDERQMVTNADSIATDVGFKISKTSLGGGWTSGGIITLKVPFTAQKDGSFRADVGGSEVGLTKTTAARFQIGIGVDSTDIPGTPVKVSVAVYGKTSASSGGYTQLVGKATV